MYDVAVIGGGIIGLTTAYEYQQKFPSHRIIVLEKETSLAYHQTGNNSGVIHSGIYYKPGSQKAINCRNGINLLTQFCDKYNINYELCGKLIVATNEDEIPALINLYERGNENGITDLQKLIPEIESDDIASGGSGVRAQALTIDGKLLDDFRIVRNSNIIHVLNAPSPAATSAFAIADNIISTLKS